MVAEMAYFKIYCQFSAFYCLPQVLLLSHMGVEEPCIILYSLMVLPDIFIDILNIKILVVFHVSF